MTISGCSENGDKESRSNNESRSNQDTRQLRVEWDREFTAWKSLDIQNYQFWVKYSLPQQDYNLIMTVKNDINKKTIYADTGYTTDIFYFNTIDELFNSVEKNFQIEENHNSSSGQTETSFSVSYDPKYHYPSSIVIRRNGKWSESKKVMEFRLPEEERWWPNERVPQLIAEYEEQRAAWEALNIKDYEFNYQQLYEPDPLNTWDYQAKITVKNGSFYESAALPDGAFNSPRETIFGVFADINELLHKEQVGWNGFSGPPSLIGYNFTIVYDPLYHFPVYFDCEEIHEETLLDPAYVKLRLGLRITEFKPLK